MPNPDASPPNPPPKRPLPFDDRPLMAAGILGFGVSIPLLAGLYGTLGPGEPRFWLGFVAFIALAAALWLGNRWLLFKQREHFDWFANPWRKLTMLVTANVIYTAPLTAAWLWLWYRLAGLPVDTTAIQLVTLANVICVIFVTHAYETVFLIRERESDLLRVTRLERMQAEAELSALKAQIDPHFLFNSLNTLGHLITHDAPRGREFCDTLAEVYRYVLASRGRDLVPLAEELEFVRAYHRLLALRFGRAMALDLHESLERPEAGRWLIPPLGLQTLLENAVKHNQMGDDQPLTVSMALEVAAPGAAVVRVRNGLQPRSSVRPSSGLGLRNLDERCRALTGSSLQVRSDAPWFDVHVPVLARAAGSADPASAAAARHAAARLGASA